MAFGIGIDSIEIERFAHWHNYQLKTLLKIFSKNEILYCLSLEKKTAERLAGHFAAKEAVYKAFSNILIKPIPFVVFCHMIEIEHLPNGAPVIRIRNHEHYGQGLFEKRSILISITHNKTMAMAVAYVT